MMKSAIAVDFSKKIKLVGHDYHLEIEGEIHLAIPIHQFPKLMGCLQVSS